MVRDEYNHSRPVSALIRDWLLYNKAGGGGGILKTVTGNPISVTDALAAPIQSLSVSLSPIQSGSGDPSPDNIRPISGRDSVTVERTGINIFDGEVVNGRYSSGEFVESGSYRCSKNPMPCYPGMQVYFRDKSNAALSLYVTLFTAAGDFVSTTSVSAGNWTIPAGSDARWFKVHTTASVYTAATPICIALEAPSAYALYDGQSATIQLGQTVYGGTLDVTNGKLTVNWAKIVLNGTQQISRENWKPQANSVGWIYPYDLTRNIVGTGAVMQNIKCDTLPSMSFNSLQSINGPGIALASNQTYGISVMYPNTTLTTASAINAFLAEHPIDVVYELATPQTITLDPATLSTLKGDNTVWSDGDDISMTYKAAAGWAACGVLSGN